MAVSIEQFTQQLSASGLMTAAAIHAFQAAISAPSQPQSGEDFARELMRAGKLTKYQASVILQGKAKSLRFGEYVVLDKLGAGGMGVVLKAQHRRMKREVAIKVLPAKSFKDPGAVQRFYREVEAAAKLVHLNIAVAYDAGEHEGMHYLVMEYVEGRDLAALVTSQGPRPVKEAVNYMMQAARGLEFAHQHGVVHRDIKPANLLLNNDGTVKILDMGLARLREDHVGAAEDATNRQLTQSGQIMGTVDYMSPEQAEDTREADHRADIYSLGCTLYRLVTGEYPFAGETMMQKLMAHREKPIPSLVAAVQKQNPAGAIPGFLEPLNGVFQKMLAKRPEDRQQSMAELLAELQAAMAPTKADPQKRSGGGNSTANVRGIEPAQDGGELSFLNFTGSAPQTNTAIAPPTTHEETINRSRAEGDTGKIISAATAAGEEKSATRKKRGSNRMPLYLGLGGGAAALAIMGVLIAVLANRAGTSAKPEPKPVVSIPKDTKPKAAQVELPRVSFTEVPVPPSDAWEWSDPVSLGPVVNSDRDDNNPTLSVDGLTLVFCSNRAGSRMNDLWTTTRRTAQEPWGTPSNLGENVNSPGDDRNPRLAADGLTLYFTSDRAGGRGKSDLWICRRGSTNAPWSEPTPLPGETNTENMEAHPFPSADGLTLLFSSDRSGGQGGTDIWQCTRANLSEPFGAPVNLGSWVNSSASDDQPALAADGLRLFFSSTRGGGNGGRDLWVSTRRSPKDSFGPAVNFGPYVNSSANEYTPLLAPDGRTLYFASDRLGGGGRMDLWTCTRVASGASREVKPLPSDTGEWSDPVNLGSVVNGNTHEGSPCISADGLTLLFDADRGGDKKRSLWMSTRDGVTDPWRTPMSLGPQVNTADDNAHPELSADGLSVLFVSRREGSGGRSKIWQVYRKSTSDPFGEPAPMSGDANAQGHAAGPFLTADGLTFLFQCVDRSGGRGNHDLWQCTRATLNEPFGMAVNLGPNVNSSSTDAEPTLSADGLRLFFMSDRAGGFGGWDLYMCERPSLQDPFRLAVNLGPRVNTSAQDGGPTLTADGNSLYFYSGRPGGRGGIDLWMCTRKKPATGNAPADP